MADIPVLEPEVNEGGVDEEGVLGLLVAASRVIMLRMENDYRVLRRVVRSSCTEQNQQ